MIVSAALPPLSVLALSLPIMFIDVPRVDALIAATLVLATVLASMSVSPFAAVSAVCP